MPSMPEDIQIWPLASTNNPLVTKTGTHRVHKYHDQQAFVPGDSGSPTLLTYLESTWKADAVSPNVATWYTMATITIRAQYMTSSGNLPVDKTLQVLIYYQRVGGTWQLDSITEVRRIGAIAADDDLIINVNLLGTNNGTVQISVHHSATMTNVRDCVVYVDIDGGGNYAS